MKPWLALLLVFATPALADCDGFRWSVAGEKAWFAAAPEPVDAGGAVEAAHAYEMTLKPAAESGFALAPKPAAAPGELGATARVEIARAGVFQVTTTREVWTDIVQGGAFARVRGVSRQRDCPVFVKSVRFAVKAGPALIQFSRAKEATLGFAVTPATEKGR